MLAAAIAVAAPFAARAAGPGPEIGMRTGFTLPFGKVADSATASLSDAFHEFVPLGLELGWRFTPNLYAGATVTYAVGLPKDCPSGSRCSGHDVILDLDLRFHALPDERIDPWFGIGAGYEWLGLSETQGGTTADASADGFEFVHAQVGADYVASGNVRLGPFVEFALGQYTGVSISSGGLTLSRDIPDKTLHEFLTFGLRVSFLP